MCSDEASKWPRVYTTGLVDTGQPSAVPFLDESQLVELPDGTVLMLSRNYRNCSQTVGADAWWAWGQGICAAQTKSTDG